MQLKIVQNSQIHPQIVNKVLQYLMIRIYYKPQYEMLLSTQTLTQIKTIHLPYLH